MSEQPWIPIDDAMIDCNRRYEVTTVAPGCVYVAPGNKICRDSVLAVREYLPYRYFPPTKQTTKGETMSTEKPRQSITPEAALAAARLIYPAVVALIGTDRWQAACAQDYLFERQRGVFVNKSNTAWLPIDQNVDWGDTPPSDRVVYVENVLTDKDAKDRPLVMLAGSLPDSKWHGPYRLLAVITGDDQRGGLQDTRYIATTGTTMHGYQHAARCRPAIPAKD